MKAIRVLSVAALLVACAFSASRPAPSPLAAEADIEPIPAPDPQGVSVETPAYVAADEATDWLVPSPMTGRVVKIMAHVGQRVKKGDPLATIGALDIVHPTSDVQKAEAVWIAAQRDFERQKMLCKIDCVRSQFADAEDDYRKARVKHQRARDRASLPSHDVGDPGVQSYTLPSPVDGEVLSCDIVPGEIVEGQYGGGRYKSLFVIGANAERMP